MSPAPVSPKARLEWVDAAKGMLIVLVVFWHVVLKSYLQVDWRIGVPIPGVWGTISDLTYPVRMPLFFLISGCFAANAIARPWAAVYRSRVLRFLYLYLLWTIIHTAALWAFPDFPTLVPRSIAEFIDAITISPPDTWYLYALALYFLLAKALRRLSAWLPLSAAAALTIAVGADYIEIVSNRGSLLANFLYFLLGLHLSRRIMRFNERPRPVVAAGSVALYLSAFAIVRATGSEDLPGVWPALALLGVGAGVSLAPLLARVTLLGPGLARLGRRTLQIYVIHMPVLALIDAVAVAYVSDARIAVQLMLAILLPIVLTTTIVVISVWIGDLIARDRLDWLFDLPGGNRERRKAPAQPAASAKLPATGGRRVGWRTPVAVLALVAIGLASTGAAAIPHHPDAVVQQAAGQSGQVSIGAVGDILLYGTATAAVAANANSTGTSIPADDGSAYFEQVRPWFTDDIVTGNLEQAISPDTGYDKCEGADDCFAFRSDIGSAESLAGFDILNLANNHSRDYGQSGYEHTRAALAAVGVQSVGDRDEIVFRQVGDITVAMIGFAPYGDFNRVTDLRRVRSIVRTAADRADIVIVQAHMGAEGRGADRVTPGAEAMYGENRGDPLAFSHAAIDAGASLVLGHGPHILRGMEWYRGRLIAYSLGNFGGGGVFGKDPATRYGAYLSVSLRADGTITAGQVQSVRFDYERGVPMPDKHGEAARLMNERSLRDFPQSAAIIGPDGALRLPLPLTGDHGPTER